ncbi:MAG: ribbon-helix-helix domain-containing protein [Halobacteriota archaeon]
MKIRFSISMAEEVVALIDAEVGKRKGFANRSQAIETSVRQLLELEDYANGGVDFMIRFLKLLDEHPGMGKGYLKFLKEVKQRSNENLAGR